ncbi:MAG: acyltransferase family protein [Deltaproteobacteria bacterium]|nr:acyltransferase family protein [Deltaproteobacteria bacterium]
MSEDRDQTLQELDAALDDLRVEIRSRFGGSAGREEETASIDWFEVFEELRRRANAFGIAERSGEVDEFGADEVVLARAQPVFDFLQDRYWRVDVDGIENLPDEGPCVLVANRSGLLPYDGIMISHAIHRAHPAHPLPRFLVADWLITLPFMQPYLARIGGVRASRDNAERLLSRGHFVVAFPEGMKGAAKLFRDRYRLQRFGRGGVIRLARDTGAPLVPVAVVGAEEVHPVLFKAETMARSFGLPFVPVTPTFPLLGPAGLLPLPSKWTIRIGKPLALDGLGGDAVEDELLISRLTEELRREIQTMVDDGVKTRPSVWG